MEQVAVLNRRCLLAVALLFCMAMPSRAGVLLLLPNVSSVQLNVGDTLTVFGSVSNVTGVGLRTTDLFLNFSGYPDTALDVTQLLGSPDIALPDRTTSAVLALFSLTALSGAIAGLSYEIDFFAVDVNGVFSDSTAITVNINPANGVPEPSSLLLGLTAFGAALGTSRRRNRQFVAAVPCHQ